MDKALWISQLGKGDLRGCPGIWGVEVREGAKHPARSGWPQTNSPKLRTLLQNALEWSMLESRAKPSGDLST